MSVTKRTLKNAAKIVAVPLAVAGASESAIADPKSVEGTSPEKKATRPSKSNQDLQMKKLLKAFEKQFPQMARWVELLRLREQQRIKNKRAEGKRKESFEELVEGLSKKDKQTLMKEINQLAKKRGAKVLSKEFIKNWSNIQEAMIKGELNELFGEWNKELEKEIKKMTPQKPKSPRAPKKTYGSRYAGAPISSGTRIQLALLR